MDDGYMEQFPIGAIDHIGLPESTLPKEVCNNLSMYLSLPRNTFMLHIL
jgi:hypothetical protein